MGLQLEEQKPEKAIVATLTPCYHHPQPAMTEAYVQMCDEARKDGIVVYNGSTIRDSSVVHWSRNQLLGNLIKSKKPWTHVLFIDDDIVCQPDSLVKLVNHKKDIIGGVCTRRQDPPIPNIRKWHEEGANFQEIFEWGTDGLMEIDAVGTGLMLISKHALEQVAEVWFKCLFEKDVHGWPDEKCETVMEHRLKRFDEHGIATWFDFLPHIKKFDIQYGEDISFCLLAKRYANLSIWVDTTVTPGHIGDYAFSVADFLPYRKQVVEDYHRKTIFCSVTGREIPKIEAPEQEKRKTSKISVLIPTRGRKEQLENTIMGLLDNANGEIEILVRQDDDEPEYRPIGSPWKLFVGPRYGYEGLHKYYNELATKATGDWLMVWNDDAQIETKGWDSKIHEHGGGLKVLNATGQLNLFPIVSRELYETLGYLSQQAHLDSWLQAISRLNGIEEAVDIKIEHTPRESYETSKEFFTKEVFEALQKDVDRVKEALKAVPVG